MSTRQRIPLFAHSPERREKCFSSFSSYLAHTYSRPLHAPSIAPDTTQEKSLDPRNYSDELVPTALTHIIFIATQSNGSLTQKQILNHCANGGQQQKKNSERLRYLLHFSYSFYALCSSVCEIFCIHCRSMDYGVQWQWCDA